MGKGWGGSGRGDYILIFVLVFIFFIYFVLLWSSLCHVLFKEWYINKDWFSLRPLCFCCSLLEMGPALQDQTYLACDQHFKENLQNSSFRLKKYAVSLYREDLGEKKHSEDPTRTWELHGTSPREPIRTWGLKLQEPLQSFFPWIQSFHFSSLSAAETAPPHCCRLSPWWWKT